MKYKGFIPDLVTITRAYWSQVTDYYNDILPNSYSYCTYVERICEYRLNATNLFTDMHSYSEVVVSVDPVDASTYSAATDSNYL